MRRNLLLFFLIVSSTAFADTDHIFKVDCQTDIAARFLSHLFGSKLINNICTAPPSASTIGEIFRIFNLGLLVFAGGFISYAAVSSALGKASDGGQAGGGKSNPWVPARLATGTMLLMPIQSGYSFIQLVVMWAVMQGVGLGNSLWNKQIELLGIPKTIEPQKSIHSSYSHIFGDFPSQSSGINEPTISLDVGKKLVITDIYAVGLCLAIKQKQNTAQQADDSSVPNITFGVYENCSEAKGKITSLTEPYICAGASFTGHQTDCGVFGFNKKIDDSDSGKKAAYTQLKMEIKNQIMAAKENAMMNLDRPMPNPVDKGSCDNPLSVCAALKNIYTNIDSIVLPLVKVEQKPNQNNNDDQWHKIAEGQGWITAGQYYYKFSSQEAKEELNYQYGETVNYLPKIEQGFSIQNGASISKQLSGIIPAFISSNLETLINNFKLTVTNNDVSNFLNEINKNNRENSAILVEGNKLQEKNPTTQGVILLLEKINLGLIAPLNSLSNSKYLDSDDVFRIESLSWGTRLTAPLDNLMVLMSLAAGELTGFDIRKNVWVKKSSDQDTIHQLSNLGACAYNSKDLFNPDCIRQNAGIIGYLNSYYQKETTSDPNFSSIATIDPLTNLGNIGKQLIKFSIDYWVNTLAAVYSITMRIMGYYSAAKIGTAVASGIASAIPFLGSMVTAVSSVIVQLMDMFYALDTYNLSLFLPLGLAISSVLFIIGILLGMYLPFIPFMIFTFTAIGWIMAVVEAMIAAPLVALGVTHPQGHDLLGKAEQAVILILGIFLRPSAIVLGFIAAIYLLKEVLVLINTGFLTLLNDVFQVAINDGAAAVSQIYFTSNIMILGVLMIYVYIIMAVVNQTFSLIYQVPEKLLRWIGAAPENTGISQIAGEVKQGMQSGGQSLAQGGQQTAGQKPEAKPMDTDDIEESMAKLSKDIKEDGDESKQDQGQIS